jgi:hypothetical protein
VEEKKSLMDELDALGAKLRATERRAESAEQERLRTAIEKGDLVGEMDEMREVGSPPSFGFIICLTFLADSVTHTRSICRGGCSGQRDG